ncbi:unnamed protein product [Ambrosiozyma monospora]|uniref:Vesicular-fusion protein SEC18 n=1 Tax=Ambrosiozyma monospora TaxID=43982 RepID=A0A9W6T9Y9_AMBMO|nr:unnamed protein product [Ambrosiozyma monospora]
MFNRRGREEGKHLLIKNSPDNNVAKSNRIAVNPQDFPSDVYVLVDQKYVFTTVAVTTTLPGTIGLSGIQRFGGSWSTDQTVSVSPFNVVGSGNRGGAYLGTVNLEIDFFNRNRTTNHQYDPDEMAKEFVTKFNNLVLQPTQLLIFEFKGMYFELKVQSTQVVELAKIALDEVPVSSNVTNRG